MYILTFCIACDLDAMFSAVFSGDRKPYSPAKFLYRWALCEMKNFWIDDFKLGAKDGFFWEF